jgi:hypothetical protein
MSLKTFAVVPIAALVACGPTPGHTEPMPGQDAPPAKAPANGAPQITPPVFRQACLNLKPLQVGAWTIPPKPLHLTAPALSPTARQLGLRGLVVIATIIDMQGKVCDAQVVKGIARNLPGLIDEPARQSILASAYSPATLDGHPVAVVFYATVRIDLSEPPTTRGDTIAP